MGRKSRSKREARRPAPDEGPSDEAARRRTPRWLLWSVVLALPFTYLMSPEMGFLTYYNRDVTPEQMAESVACFIDHAS